MMEKYLRQQTVKSIGHLVDIFTNRDVIRQDRIFNPSMAYTQMNTNQSYNQEDGMPDYENMGISDNTIVTIVDEGMIADMKPSEINTVQAK